MKKLSVIIPCFNNGNYLREMMDCCLKQTFKDWELIIVDDQSTDGITPQIVKDYAKRDDRIRFLVRNRSPKGSVVCRNIGYEYSTGEYVIHFDADDLISDTCFEKRVKFMDENQDCDYASFPVKSFWDGEPLPKWNGKSDFGVSKGCDDLICYFLKADYPFSVWCNIYRRKSIENIPWDENVKIYTDFSYIIPCILAGLKHKFSNLQEYDYYYRYFRKGNNMCSNFVSQEKCESTIYLFKKVIRDLNKLPNSNKYLRCFEGFVKLHFERLLQTNNPQRINDYIAAMSSPYPKLAKKMIKVHKSVLNKLDGHINQARMHLILYMAFGRKFNRIMCVHELAKWVLRM